MSRGNRCGLFAVALACLAAIHCGDDTMYRYKAPIAIERPGTFVLVRLPAEAYARSRSGDLGDVRVADARGHSVPFALLYSRRSEVRTADQVRDAAIYPLPPRPATDGTWPSPIELTVQGDRIDVRRRAGSREERAGGLRSGGWLVDLGERKPQDPRARLVRFEWSGPVEFTAAFEFDTSDDLRRWQSGGPGQLMALSSPSGTVSQRDVMLQPGAGRFVRLVWADAANAPAIIRAQGFYPEQQTVELDPPVELVFSPVPPASKEAAADAGPSALYYDLGGSLPIGQITLRWDEGTHVVPARVEGQDHPGKGWWPLSTGVFYQIERNGVVGSSALFSVSRSARYLRVVPDPRAGPLDPKRTRLLVRAHLASVLFAAQGEPPYSLFAGSVAPSTGPLPADSLVPSLEDERPRFGTATLGAWSEDAAAARQAESAGRRAALRLGLLWTVLIVGVAGLAFMVWRLTRSTTTGKS
jgi:hypothetical protein